MADKFFRVALESTCGGQQVVNTFCVFGDDAIVDFSPLSAQGLADKLGGTSAFTDAYRGLLDNQDSFDQIVVRELLAHGDTSIPQAGLHTVAAAGTRIPSDRDLPLMLCQLLRLKTNVAVRGGQGHWFLPPVKAKGDISAGRWSDAGTSWSHAQTMITELGHWNKGGSAWGGGTSWGLGVYSRTRRNKGAAQFAFHTVAFELDDALHWLDSREPAGY